MTEHPHPIVIAGAGAAGGEAAVSLRQQGYAGPIVLLGDEAYPPYHRPPLSKAFLGGEAALPGPRALAAFYLKDGILIAADVVGHPSDFLAARKLVGLRAACRPEHLADPTYPLKHYLEAAKTAA
jgi:NADPH-dependent 2,4-dienoyl-CoA reductase/sulfur reductase-like enzyme